jgi:hypothetical protein
MRRALSPTGLALWTDLPVATGASIMWSGPGAGLFIGQCTIPGGKVLRITHPSADGQYETLKEATAAVDRFIATLKEAGW